MLIPCDNEPDKDTQTGKVARAKQADGKASVKILNLEFKIKDYNGQS